MIDGVDLLARPTHHRTAETILDARALQIDTTMRWLSSRHGAFVEPLIV